MDVTQDGRGLGVELEDFGEFVTVCLLNGDRIEVSGDGQVLLTNGYGEVFTMVRA